MILTDDKQVWLPFLNHYLALATLIGSGVLIVAILYVPYILNTKKSSKILNALRDVSLPLGFFMSLAGTCMSLYYSDYLGILPCGLCWFQRVFLYSQVVLFGVAWLKKDRGVFVYSLGLSIFGLIMGLYHQYLQMGYSELLPCPAIASTIDCAKPTFIEYGFVTFPLMSVVLFSFLILLSFISKKETSR